MWSMIVVGLVIAFGIFALALFLEDDSMWFEDEE